MNATTDHLGYRDIAATIVSAYITRNPVSTADLPRIIETVCYTLRRLQNSEDVPDLKSPRLQARIAGSVTDTTITCLECGKRLQTIKRHIMTAHDMTVEEYRDKFGLSDLYPAVAPFYSRVRRNLAKDIGLGTKQVNRARSERPGTDSPKSYVVI
jgi:predicted transcriptional regulator